MLTEGKTPSQAPGEAFPCSRRIGEQIAETGGEWSWGRRIRKGSEVGIQGGARGRPWPREREGPAAAAGGMSGAKTNKSAS